MKDDYYSQILCNYTSQGNNFRKLTVLTLLFISLISLSLHADVFLLGGGDGKAWGADLLGGAKLWSEPAVINGVKSSVQLVLLQKQLDECYRILKQQFKDAKFRFNDEALLVEVKRENGNLERIYLVKVGEGKYPVLQFSMEIPPNLPDKPEWPHELPQLYDSEPVTVINLTNRGTLYGAFTSFVSSEQILNQMDSSMLADGWKSIGRGTYLKDNPTRMILISASEDKNGKTYGFILKRNLLCK